jgi:hypothetical protein
MDDWRLRLPAWRRRLEGEKAAKRYVAEHAEPQLEVPGLLPPVGQTATFIRRLWEVTVNRFAWLNDDLPTPRMPPPIFGAQNVPTVGSSPPPGLPGVTSSFHHLRRRRH